MGKNKIYASSSAAAVPRQVSHNLIEVFKTWEHELIKV